MLVVFLKRNESTYHAVFSSIVYGWQNKKRRAGKKAITPPGFRGIVNLGYGIVNLGYIATYT